ncbi:hypothetical protein PR202_gb25721 [Eleusine coracana subsp. coracana]|uniref:Uncharacterized protein n=1 Tax=Eleusine coracana subsp. coracana TaxID=191504 RepID=A0AAV5FMD5_ELECO|nr:hypothetical protein PR202_gb25721 [Eleusine coracana subsp. coracana]
MSWPEIRTFRVQYNSLAGNIPPESSNITKLQSLALYRNSFSGQIPEQIGRRKNLQVLEDLVCRLPLCAREFDYGLEDRLDYDLQARERQQYNTMTDDIDMGIRLPVLARPLKFGKDMATWPPLIAALPVIKDDLVGGCYK